MKHKITWVRLLALVLVTGVLLSLGSSMDSFTVRAGTAKERYEELEKELEELDSTIGKLSERAEEAAERREALADQISVIKEQINLLSGQIHCLQMGGQVSGPDHTFLTALSDQRLQYRSGIFHSLIGLLGIAHVHSLFI